MEFSPGRLLQIRINGSSLSHILILGLGGQAGQNVIHTKKSKATKIRMHTYEKNALRYTNMRISLELDVHPCDVHCQVSIFRSFLTAN